MSSIRMQGTAAILDLEGRYTASDGRLAELKDQIQECLASARYKRIVVNLAEVVAIDSAGIGTVVSGAKEAARQGVKFVLANPQPRLKELLLSFRLPDVIELHDSVEDAIG